MGMFEYAFMVKAFAVGLMLAVIVPCVGVIVVLKRLSMVGDALSHASLAGVAAGLVLGINPVVGSVAACIAAALGIEAIRKRLPRFSEMAIAIIMSAGIGLAGVLASSVKNTANFSSFLFGSIVAISDAELFGVMALGAVVLLFFLLLYRELFYIAQDERAARLAGVPVWRVNFIFTILTAVTVSVAARTVGALVVSSLMILPVACAMQLANSYKKTVLYSIGFALLFVSSGLFLSYYQRLRPGGAITLIGVGVLVLLLLATGMKRSVVHFSHSRR